MNKPTCILVWRGTICIFYFIHTPRETKKINDQFLNVLSLIKDCVMEKNVIHFTLDVP